MMHQTMKNLFEIQKSLTLSMISLQGHRGVSSGLGYHKQAPLSGLPIRYHFRVTRESIPTVFSQTTNSLYSSRTVAIAENRLPRNRCLPFALSTMVIRPRSRTLEDLSLLSRSRAYTGGSCKMGVLCSFEMNDARRKRFRNRTYGMGCSCLTKRFSTLVVEKVYKLSLVFPHLSLSRQLLLGSIVCCLTLYLIYYLYLSNGDKDLGPRTPKTILYYKTIWPLHNRKPLIRIKAYFQKLRGMFAGIDGIDLIEPVERTDIPKVSWTRRYILITIRMGKSSRINDSDILTRLLRVFHCRSILIGEETLMENDCCIHIGISNTNASKNTFQAYIRGVFPELGEKQLNVRARKSWNSVYQYVERMSDTFTIWTEGTTPTIVRKEKQTCAPWQEKNREKRSNFTTVLEGREKKENKERETIDQYPTRRVTNKEVYKLLREKESWDEVINDPVLGPRLINNYLNIRNVYVDLQAGKRKKELEEMGLSLLKQEVVLLCYRVFYLDKTLALRFTVIFLMYLVLGSLPFFFSGLNKFVIDLLWQEPKSGPEPESKPTLNQQPSSPKDSTVNICALILFTYLVLRILAGNH